MSDAKILRLADEHFHAATDGKVIPDYGRWKEWTTNMRRVIGTFDKTIEVLHFAQNHKSLPFSHRGKAFPELFDVYYDILRDEFPWFITRLEDMGDNPQSIASTLARSEKMLVSDMFFWHVWSLFTIQSQVPDIRSVIEIGGGDGALTRLWCLHFPVDHYTIVDLPESLYFSEVCLSAVFGDEVAYFPEEAKITLVPVDRLEEYKGQNDIVVSIGSIQEMDDSYVTYYMNWLDGCGANYFYSLNYAAQPLTELRESRCWWGPRPSTQWSTKLLSLDPAIIRIMCSKRHFLQALYHRSPCKGTLSRWSVLKGRDLTLATYLEGLDLIRQDPNSLDIAYFMDIVLSNDYMLEHHLLPKEMYALAQLVNCKASRAVKEYHATNEVRMVE